MVVINFDVNQNHNNHGYQLYFFALNFNNTQPGNKLIDDDVSIKQTNGAVWAASAHIITAVIGSGILSLGWATAQLGWIAGPIAAMIFSVIYCTFCLLAQCYRPGDPVSQKRNYTYMDAVRSNLGGMKVILCEIIRYVILFGLTIGDTIAASISMVAIMRSNCFQVKGHNSPCRISSIRFMILFGVLEIVISQIPNSDQLWWLSIVAAVVSFIYSTVDLGLGITKFIPNGTFIRNSTGISVGVDILTNQIHRTFQALGDMAFAYSYSTILAEIVDIERSPPKESKTMKKSTLISVAVTTIYLAYCLLGLGLRWVWVFNPFWLVDIANLTILIYFVGAYQLHCQPLFAFVEKTANGYFVTKDIKIPIPGCSNSLTLNLFRLVWRTMLVMMTTYISMRMPFFNDFVGLHGALGFWPLTIHIPVEIYVFERKIPKWSMQWICLQTLSGCCVIITFVAVADL